MKIDWPDYPLVKICWLDASSYDADDWKSLDTTVKKAEADDMRICTVGWVTFEDDLKVQVIPNISSHLDICSGNIAIPKCAIINRTKISG